jgi:uncharacterized protein (TIGR02996 family)
MSQRGFQFDIAEHPDDDTPRLIYADWLEDHGDEAQAEFIRVQIRRSRLPLEDLEQPTLARREAQLLARYEARWAGDLAEIAIGWTFSRGFIERVHVRQLCELTAYLHQHPLPLRTVQFERLGELRHAGDLSALRYLRELEACYVALPGVELAPLIESPHLGSLRRLQLKAAHLIGPLAVEMLVQAPWAPELRSLSLSMMNLTQESARLLAETPVFGQLRSLDVSFNALIGDRGAALLLRSSLGRHLTSLDLTDTGLTGRGARELGAMPQLERLETLRLGHNALGGPGAAVLLQSQYLTGLKHLDLSNARIGSRGLGVLSTGIPGDELEELKLSRCDLTADTLRDLLVSPTARRLQVLDIGNNALEARGARVLAEHCPESLRILDLRFCNLGDAGVETLTASKRLGRLHTLILHANQLGVGSARALAGCNRLPRLRVLGLRNNALDTQAAQALIASSHLHLTSLQLEVNSLTSEDREQLRDHFGGCVGV